MARCIGRMYELFIYFRMYVDKSSVMHFKGCMMLFEPTKIFLFCVCVFFFFSFSNFPLFLT